MYWWLGALALSALAGGAVFVVRRIKAGESAQVRYDNWGSQRYAFDVNQPLEKTGVAVRVNAIRAENESARQRAGTELRGYAGALRW